MSAEARILELGLVLPAAAAPAGLYLPCVQAGDLLFVSGQLPIRDGAIARTGHCGENVALDEAAGLARLCALNALAVVRQQLGSLDRVVRVVRVAGYVASAPGFVEHPRVVNGASQLLVEVFGEAGRHARVAIGVAELPLGVPVEVEAVFQVEPS